MICAKIVFIKVKLLFLSIKYKITNSLIKPDDIYIKYLKHLGPLAIRYHKTCKTSSSTQKHATIIHILKQQLLCLHKLPTYITTLLIVKTL